MGVALTFCLIAEIQARKLKTEHKAPSVKDLEAPSSQSNLKPFETAQSNEIPSQPISYINPTFAVEEKPQNQLTPPESFTPGTIERKGHTEEYVEISDKWVQISFEVKPLP